MQQEIEVRQQASALGLPIPELEAVAEDGTWFKERYLSGTPLNRLPDSVAHEAIIGASRALHKLLQDTTQEGRISEYAGRLVARAREYVAANPLLDNDRKQALRETLDCLLRQVKALQTTVGGCMLTSLTHGDFQPANILVDERGPWLIDWEYAARRQVGYDALVFGLKSRFPDDLAARLKAFVTEGPDQLESVGCLSWPGVDWRQGEARQLYGSLFLLEELVLHLEENASPCFTKLGNGLSILQNEIVRWVVPARGA
jgi:aminoglycoside phosphotransferase (APT) family kinase protein